MQSVVTWIKEMAYIIDYCPVCDKETVFNEIRSWSGTYRECTEPNCYFWEIVKEDDEEEAY